MTVFDANSPMLELNNGDGARRVLPDERTRNKRRKNSQTIVDNDEIRIGSHVERPDFVLHSQKLQECQDDDVTVGAKKHIKEGRETSIKSKDRVLSTLERTYLM
jgi:hypothetical protein